MPDLENINFSKFSNKGKIIEKNHGKFEIKSKWWLKIKHIFNLGGIQYFKFRLSSIPPP